MDVDFCIILTTNQKILSKLSKLNKSNRKPHNQSSLNYLRGFTSCENNSCCRSELLPSRFATCVNSPQNEFIVFCIHSIRSFLQVVLTMVQKMSEIIKMIKVVEFLDCFFLGYYRPFGPQNEFIVFRIHQLRGFFL